MPPKSKTKKVKAEPKLEKTAPVTQFKIPARYKWAETPLGIASQANAEAELRKLTADTFLEGVVVGDFVAVRNQDCDETFILHKDVLRELAEASS